MSKRKHNLCSRDAWMCFHLLALTRSSCMDSKDIVGFLSPTYGITSGQKFLICFCLTDKELFLKGCKLFAQNLLLRSNKLCFEPALNRN